jgi:hypothetical protein
MPRGSDGVETSDFVERAGVFSGGGPIGWDHAQVCLLLRVHPVCDTGCEGYFIDSGDPAGPKRVPNAKQHAEPTCPTT